MTWDGNPAGSEQLPAGSVTMFASNTTPTGWLTCDGSAVSRTTYASLFAVIGTTFGAGDGSTTFNVPDMAGRFPLGRNPAGGFGVNVGDSDGQPVANRRLLHYHSHSHTVNNHTHSIAGVSYPTGVNYANGSTGQATSRGAYDGHNHGGATGGSAPGTGGPSGENVGGSFHPLLTLNFIIKT